MWVSGVHQQGTNNIRDKNVCYFTLSRMQVIVSVEIMEIITLQRQAPNLQYVYLSQFHVTANLKPPMLQTTKKKKSVIHDSRNSGPQGINAPFCKS